MTNSAVYLSAATIINAIRSLTRVPANRTARTALLGYLILKSRETTRGTEIELRAVGSGSVKPELDRFLGLAVGTPLPYVNPFGVRQGRLEWLADEYERRGTYTQLYPGRALNRFLDVRVNDGSVAVRIPDAATTYIAEQLHGKVPLEPTAAFLLRNEAWPINPTAEDIIARFTAVFHLTEDDVNNLFERDADFHFEFDSVEFVNALASLPPDLHPPSPIAGQTAAVEAASQLTGLVSTQTADLLYSDVVWRRLRRSLSIERAIALVGPPGTGKSRLISRLIEEARANPSDFNLARPPEFDLHAAETDWTARTIIGGYFPQEDGHLAFQEGYLLSALRANRWLILDEMNRADLDRVLGPILTFLAGQHVNVGRTDLTNNGKPILLAWTTDSDSGMLEDEHQRVYVAGSDWRILGSYNNVDVGRVFSMGAALSRRWVTIPISPITADQFGEVVRKVAGLPNGAAELIQRVYALHLTVLPLGPAPFIDMARYCATEHDAQENPSASAGAVAPEVADRLRDAYVLHLSPQLRRLDPDRREDFLRNIGGILGSELANELASL